MSTLPITTREPIYDYWRPKPIDPDKYYLHEEDLANFFYAYFKTEYDPNYFKEPCPIPKASEWNRGYILRESTCEGHTKSLRRIIQQLDLDCYFVDAVIERTIVARPPKVHRDWVENGWRTWCERRLGHVHHHTRLLRKKRYDLLEVKLLAEQNIVQKLFDEHVAQSSAVRAVRAAEVRELFRDAMEDPKILGWMFCPSTATYSILFKDTAGETKAATVIFESDKTE
ncbi:hypothetical protein K490DRAFT_63424 [Saccharata proteae CBS 121410]|uniref:Uncharacterized protein n=1 Tax=Saccharata proteae CBS 121410 TaxID=1314787 RepID=A0A6A5YC55_9PEZI|nr:hypothetical protein K490DRAFT_63424 [Saccharata proteae CBS 121410]